MKLVCLGCAVLTALAVTYVADSSCALEIAPYRMADDFAVEPPPLAADWALQYYYYIPAPTASWFWGANLEPGEILGVCYHLGDLSTGGYSSPDPEADYEYQLVGFRILDFAGYGRVYPGLYTVEFDIYCADYLGCPVGHSLWNSGQRETGYGWNYVDVDPSLDICECASVSHPYLCFSPRFIILATQLGQRAGSPAWGLDNISSPARAGVDMHDVGGLPALYPRPAVSTYPLIHSGRYGQDFTYCPPQAFADGRDSTAGASEYGYLELAWRVYFDTPGG